MITGRLVMSVFPLVVTAGQGVAQRTGEAVPITRIDHIVVITPHAEHVATVLSDSLGLPVVWPQPGAVWTRSSGISLGNVNLELMLARADTVTAFVGALALQTSDFDQVRRALEERGVPHGEPSGWPPGDSVPKQWTTMGIPGMGIGFFFVQYHRFDMDERRRLYNARLQASGGGALGVVAVAEVRVPVPDLEKARKAWTRVVELPEDGLWQPELGPAVRLVQSESETARTLVVKIRSLERAGAVLRELGIGFVEGSNVLVLDRKRFYGLPIELREAERGG